MERDLNRIKLILVEKKRTNKWSAEQLGKDLATLLNELSIVDSKMMYTPPFKITSRILNLVAEISAKIERYAILLEQDTELRLRKANRIKTIHSSLAIEGNELTEGQVRDIINGRNVVAPLREIQEVNLSASSSVCSSVCREYGVLKSTSLL